MSTLRPEDAERLDANRLRIPGEVPAVVFANERVHVGREAIEELRGLLELRHTVERAHAAAPELFSVAPEVERLALSPDFHKGAGIPIGTSLLTRGFCVPQAVGNDINCGVRLHVCKGVEADRVRARLDALEPALRRLFFEGGRAIPLGPEQRRGLLRDGLPGLLDAPRPPAKGTIWEGWDDAAERRDLARVRHGGRFPTSSLIPPLEEYAARDGLVRDSQIGSVGGGNHFVELQRVKRVVSGAAAHAWGLEPGTLVVMVHSGSVGIGHACGGWYVDAAKKAWPKGLPWPANGIFPLPDRSPAWGPFFSALHTAAHFAFANRLFLARMARQALEAVLGSAFDFPLVYDTPHNLAWVQDDGRVLHRKGASPAGGHGAGPDEWFGEPVLVPGSMGSSSWVLEGRGLDEALGSASHGAGRQEHRGAASHHTDAELDRFLAEFRVVTALDPARQDVKRRPEILEAWRRTLKEEAPWAYKPVTPVIETLEGAGIAVPVAELTPLLTVKG